MECATFQRSPGSHLNDLFPDGAQTWTRSQRMKKITHSTVGWSRVVMEKVHQDVLDGHINQLEKNKKYFVGS